VPRFRRRFSGRGRSKKPLDWVTQSATYNLELPPNLIPDGSLDFVPLTLHADISADPSTFAAASRYPQLEQTAVRIKGQLWCWILPTSNWWETLTGRTFFKFRVSKGLQVDQTPSAIGSVTNITNPTAGNIDFMWEHTEYFIAHSAWGDLVVDPSMYIRRIEVDITTKRRLKQPEALTLHVQYGPGMNYNGEDVAFPDGAWDSQLRTLIQTNT